MSTLGDRIIGFIAAFALIDAIALLLIQTTKGI